MNSLVQNSQFKLIPTQLFGPIFKAKIKIQRFKLSELTNVYLKQ